MSKELVISSTPHETRVAILEDGQLCEIYVEREKEYALVGSIYKGRVTRVLPGMQSAFVDIGLDTDAFLYVSDVLEDIEEYDHIVSTVEGKVQKMEQQGGEVFSSPAAPEAPVVAPAEPQPSVAETPTRTPATTAPPPSSGSPQHGQESRGYGRGRDRFRRGRGRRGGRGDERRHGRELPPSKYTSPRPYEPSLPEEGHEPIILPGESLAKYRNRIPQPTAATTVTEEPVQPAVAGSAPVPSVPAKAQPPVTAGEQGHITEEKIEHAPEASPQQLELAGAEPLAAEPEISPAGPEKPFMNSAPETTQSAEGRAQEGLTATSEPHEAPEMTGEEATALAEHLAEAQEEEHEAASEDLEAREEDRSEDEEAFTEGEESVEGAAEAGAESGEEAEAIAAAEAPRTEPAANLEPVPPMTPASVESQPVAARIDDNARARLQRPIPRRGRHRGGRRPRPHERPFPARRPQQISELLKAGQEIIIQIAKEPLGKKGARITSHVALPGRFLVYMPTLDHLGVSRKIASAEQRSRLRRLVSELKATSPGGFIVRTAAEKASDEDIRNDVEFLTRTWTDIRARAEQRKAPALLHRDLNLVERILRDYLSSDYSAIWVDSEEEYARVLEFVSRFQPDLVSRVKLYTKETPIFEELGIQQEIDRSLRPKVWLKSGGYIVINHTEALVAIDVNTGKYVGRGSTRLEDTIVRTNIEAVKEIVRQIRLRDLGGIIVIDFIDMEERRNREKVLQALEEALRSDRAPSKVLPFNEFGLVAITRKRTKQALERVLCQPCPYCTGSGMVKSVPTICYEIQTEARKMSAELDSQNLTLRVHPEIAKALKTRESALVEELERVTHKTIIIQSDPTLHWEQYDIY